MTRKNIEYPEARKKQFVWIQHKVCFANNIVLNTNKKSVEVISVTKKKNRSSFSVGFEDNLSARIGGNISRCQNAILILW